MSEAPRPQRALRLAHRGDARSAPENTVAAMRAALALPNCDGLEFDVRGSRDGVPVVLHDETLQRVQHVAADVTTLVATELAARGVPSLGDVLEAAGRDCFLDVELKGEPVDGVIDVLAEARGTGPAGMLGLARTVVSSFEAETLAWLGHLRPAWVRWLNAEELSEPTIRTAREIGCRGISVDWRAIDRGAAHRVAEAGLDMAAWTVRRLPTAARLDRLGVVAMCVEGSALDG